MRFRPATLAGLLIPYLVLASLMVADYGHCLASAAQGIAGVIDDAPASSIYGASRACAQIFRHHSSATDPFSWTKSMLMLCSSAAYLF